MDPTPKSGFFLSRYTFKYSFDNLEEEIGPIPLKKPALTRYIKDYDVSVYTKRIMTLVSFRQVDAHTL